MVDSESLATERVLLDDESSNEGVHGQGASVTEDQRSVEKVEAGRAQDDDERMVNSLLRLSVTNGKVGQA